ncbi:MAG: AAA family ATPase [Patescibacteria group bacterium]|nr:AAA family ATPase [Patescibacteria group bacterium]
MNFFVWYFTKGLKDYFAIWKNFVHFFLRFFSVWPLLSTLFVAWHKDLTPHDWRGIRPIKSAEVFAVNLVLRFFGAIVRLVVVTAGIMLVILTVFFGAVILIIWVLFPFVLAFSIFNLILGDTMAISYLVLLLIFFTVALKAFFDSKRTSYEKMTMEELFMCPLFDRVLARIDAVRDDVDKKLLGNFEKFRKFLKSHNITPAEFDIILQWEISFQKKKDLECKFWRKKYLDRFMPIGRHWEYGYAVTLDSYAVDLTRFDPTEYRYVQLIGYKKELDMAKLVLKRKNQNNVLLVGSPGIGKKSLVHYIAKLIHFGQVDKKLQDKRVMLIDLGSAISSVVDQGGDPEHAMHSLFQEAAYAGNIILAIDNIAKYLDPIKGSSVNIAASLDRYLSLPTFQVIATATNNKYHGLIEKHESILKNFDVIEVKEPTEEESIAILIQKFSKEEQSRVIFTFQAFREIVKKSTHLGKIMPLPERAVDLAHETLLHWKKDAESEKKEKRRIVAEDVAKVLSIKTGIPQGEIKDEEKYKLLNLEKIMHHRVIGQDGAVIQLSNAMRKMRSGIGSDEKPVGSFLFLGPTGVGKTETAKTLAEVYFGDENRMIRFDMSEFQNPNGVERLIGSRKMDQPGILTSKVKDNPFSVILLDEIEKAYPRILDLFLQVLDEGFLTDAFGEKVSFRGSIIIGTSNAGAPLIKKLVEEKVEADEIRKRLIDHIIEEEIFRVEFLNRFDDVIFFRVLNTEQLKKIVEIKLAIFAKRLDENKNIQVKFEEGVTERIIEKGYDPVFGARAINRYIADKIENTASNKIVSQQIKKGKEFVIKVDDLD